MVCDNGIGLSNCHAIVRTLVPAADRLARAVPKKDIYTNLTIGDGYPM
jgi:hypothetical protein